MGACLQCSLLWSDDSGSCEFLPGSPARTTETGRSNSQFAAIHLWSAVHFYEKPEAGRRRNAFQASALRSVGGSESREWSRALRQKKRRDSATRCDSRHALERGPLRSRRRQAGAGSGAQGAHAARARACSTNGERPSRVAHSPLRSEGFEKRNSAASEFLAKSTRLQPGFEGLPVRGAALSLTSC